MEKGQILEITIEDIGTEGQGIGKYDGLAIFVKDTVVGDIVKVELTKLKKNYAFAKVVEVVSPSPYRIEAVCKYNRKCGGCVFGTTSYEGQLAVKEKQVRDRLTRLGGLVDPAIRPIIGMEEPFRYRNKAGMPVSTGGLITKKGGIVEPVHEPRIGFFQAKSHDVVDCEDCMLQSEPAMAAAEALRRFMKEDNITSYDPRWDKGLMKHMIVRTAAGTGEVMVILVINGKGIPNGQKLVEMLDEAIYNVPVYEEGPLAGVEFNLESVILNINKGKGNEIMGEECITLAGKPTITETFGDLSFEISPLAFYQVNREQMVKLYGKAIEYADLKGGETVLDLYCGVGTIGLFCANEMKKMGDNSGQVIGIESVKGAVVNANRNAVINNIVNARYVCGKAEEELPKMVGMAPDNRPDDDPNKIKIDHADVVILDPPRAGCDPRLLESVLKIAPERIVYVSCDPATLGRDIKLLEYEGYKFVEATPVDMFPWTGHVEVVSLLSRIKTSDKVEVKMDIEDGEVTP